MRKINIWIACLAVGFSGCKDDPPQPAPPTNGELQTPTALPEGASLRETPPPEAQPDVPPPRDPSLSRTFQGDLLAEIRLADGRLGTFRYTSDADHARLQLQGLEPQFDVLVDADRIVRFNHDARSYQSHRLDEFDEAVEREATVRQDVSGGRTTHAGLTCQKQTLRTETLRVEACVRGLPGDFELGVLEGVTEARSPDWLLALLRQGQIPVAATGFDPKNDREVFTFAVTRYAPEALPEAVFEIPENYRLEGGKPNP